MKHIYLLCTVMSCMLINSVFADELDDEIAALEDELSSVNTPLTIDYDTDEATNDDNNDTIDTIDTTERDIFIDEEVGKSIVRTQYGAVVENGKVVESAILADAMGVIFIEFPMHTRVRIKNGPSTYNGLIKRPSIIDAVDKAPKGGYATLLTFALETDTNDDIHFTDRFAGLSNRELLKLKYSTEKVNMKRKNGATMVLLLPDGVGKAALYRYNTDDENTKNDDKQSTNWVRIGGTMKTTSDNKTIFKAPLSRTGTYAIIDESPLPYYPTTYVGDIDIAKITDYESPEIPDWYHYSEDVLRVGELLGEFTPQELEDEIASHTMDIDDIEYPRLPDNEQISTTPPAQLVEKVNAMNANKGDTGGDTESEIDFIAGVDEEGNAIEMASPEDAMTLRERLIQQLRDRATVNSNDFESAERADDTGGVGTGTPDNTLVERLPETGNSLWIALSTLILGAIIGVIVWHYNTNKQSI